MYTPKHYAVTDKPKMFDFMRNNSFGILFSHTGDEPMASHLPFMIDENGGEQGLVLGHMAKANRQWRYADGQQVMVDYDGYPVKPRDLTAGIFKGSGSSEELWYRIIAGLPGSPMPGYQGAYKDLSSPIHENCKGEPTFFYKRVDRF